MTKYSTNRNGHQEAGEGIEATVPIVPTQPHTNGNGYQDGYVPAWVLSATPDQLKALYREVDHTAKRAAEQFRTIEELNREVRRLREALEAQGVTPDPETSPGYESSLPRELAEARAEVRALSNAALGRTALTLVTIIKLYAENERLARRRGDPDDRGWITIWNNQILGRIGATGRGSENRLRKDIELGEAMGVIEKRLLQTTGTKPGEDGKAKRSVKTECQYRPSANVAELFSMIATYAGPGERRGSAPGEHRGAAKPDAKRCPTCRRVVGRNHAHRDTNP